MSDVSIFHLLDPKRLAFLWLLKIAILLGGLGLVQEGLLELPRVSRAFLTPPGVPGQSKIIEHFAVQHVLLPVLAILLVFYPMSLKPMLASPIIRVFLGMVLLLVTLPEIIVSFRGDLFQPYRFELGSRFLNSIQIIAIGKIRINLLQVLHLLLSHFALMGTIVWICISPKALDYFASVSAG